MTNKRLRKVLAKTLVASMIMSMMSFHSFADEAPLTPQPTVTETTVTNEDGTKTTTTIVVSVPETVGSSTIEQTTMESTTVKENEDGSTTEISGSSSGTITETTEKTENLSPVTVELKEGQQTTASSTPADPVVGGEDPKNGDDDHNYNQTVTTETPREVTANMGESSVASGTGENVETQKEIGLNPVQEKWDGTEQNISAPSPDRFNPDYENKPNGYDLYYSGWGEDSHYGVKYTETPEATEENPNPTSTTSTGNVIQLQLKDSDGTIHNAYCVDLSTTTKDGWWYKIENLEDAGYYPDENAENHIRAIVNNGYWGTEEGTKGSLQYIKDSLNAVLDQNPDALGGLKKEDIALLTEGEAQTATQMAIWTYGNQVNGELTLDAATSNNGTDEQKAAWNRINKIMNYWITLSETNDDATDVITEDKFIQDMSLTVGDKVENHANNADDNDDNDAYNVDLTFSLIVQPSADNDDLIVKVLDSQGNTVKVARLAGDDSTTNYGKITPDANGNYTLTDLELVEGNDIEFNLKLEGAQYLKEGVYIYTSQVKNETSSQTFVGIAEGYQAVDVNMKVNLNFDVKEGTIVKETTWERTWKNDTEPDKPTTSTPSNATPNDPTPNNPTPDTPTVITETETPEPVVVIEDTDVPLAVAGAYSIPDEEIPLAVLPMTGDASVIWLFLSMISGFGLAGLTLVDKRKKN